MLPCDSRVDHEGTHVTAANHDEALGRATRALLASRSNLGPSDIVGIVEAMRTPRDPSRNPLFQVSFRVMTGPLFLLKLPGLTSSFLMNDCVNSRFDRALDLWVDGEKFGGFFECRTDLFEATTIR